MPEEKIYPEWFKKLMQDVYDMRQAQKDYFSQSNDYRLKIAKAKEGRVDQHLATCMQQGIIKQKEKKSDTQTNLF